MLMLIPILLAPLVYAETPSEYGKEQGTADALANTRDATAACDQYEHVHNDNSTAPAQCYHAYDLAFNQTCLAHPSLMKYREDVDPERQACSILYK